MKKYKTLLLENNETGIKKAAALLRAGEIVGIPTETVYGLAANALNASAIRRIFKAKGRPQDNPLIVHIAELNSLYELVMDVSDTALQLAMRFWPGPLTMVFAKKPVIPDILSAGLATVAIRMPSHPTALSLIKAANVPLAAPSANRSGSPSPTTASHVIRDMDGRIPAVLDGGACSVGVESTILDLTGEVPCLLRPGGITPEMIRSVTGKLKIHRAVTAELSRSSMAISPGMKYKHYSPKAHVVLVKGSPQAFTRFVNSRSGEGVVAMCFDKEQYGLEVPYVTYGARGDAAGQARQLFSVLRRLDDIGAKTVYCACPNEREMGLAVYNRLLRAAGFEVIELD
ncbi:MAG: L-threonylcarbamoyladenylate synthase [Oscillospiraceae bacterium]|nr:L-threonylcarbamoyladenylate synthase [Oscillospiraceae bacterium]